MPSPPPHQRLWEVSHGVVLGSGERSLVPVCPRPAARAALAAVAAGQRPAETESAAESREGTPVPMPPRGTLTFPPSALRVLVPGCRCCPSCVSAEASGLSSEVSPAPAHSLAPHSRGQGPRSPSTPAQGEVLPGPGPPCSRGKNESCFIPRLLHISHYEERAPQ